VWAGRGKRSYASGLKIRQLTLSMGSARRKFASSYKEPPFQVRGYPFKFINTTHAIYIICMPKYLYSAG
jgi:hypothetical protein